MAVEGVGGRWPRLHDARRVVAARVPDALRGGPFTTAQAAAEGVTKSALRRTEWRHVFRNVWVHRSIEDSREMRVAAARLVLGAEGFICGLTAAWVYGVDARDRRWNLVWMGRHNGDWRRPRPGCFVREITVVESDLDAVEGALMTTPVRTAFDCARWLSFTEAVVVADALVHDGLMTVESFRAYVRNHRKLRGVRQADWVASVVEPLTESPMETRLRLLLINAGFEAPVAQYVVTDRAGRFVGRADLAYPEQRLIIEYDGSLHWDQRREDDRRRDAMRALGWTVLVASRADYFEHPQAFLAQVRRAFSAAA
jgi:very-short-patch-repair endonuclease